MSNNKPTTANQQEDQPVTFQLTVPTDDSNAPMATDPIDIPGSSSHRIQLNDKGI